MSLISYIPSPGSGSIHIGPLQLRAYGLMIAIGAIVAVRILGRRLVRQGLGGADEANSVALWAVPAGVIGSRLYHVATDWERFSNHLLDIPKIWQGGLGIPGGILGGTVVAIWQARRLGIGVHPLLWGAAPAVPIAQSIGRWGNWWNQELYGRPTTLPWGLRIDADKVLAGGFPEGTLFHPTFLYEALWNLMLAALLVVVGRRLITWQSARPARLFAVYVAGYGVGRFWVEGLRIDPAKSGGGLRLNQWTAIVLIVLGVGYLLYTWLRPSEAAAAVVNEEDVVSEEENDER